MRLWHQSLIPYLDRQRLLGQHRELAALRGKGWGRKHSVVNYVFSHNPELLVAYHLLVMDEMENRGYHPDRTWNNPGWRGTSLGEEKDWANNDMVMGIYDNALMGHIIYPEHNKDYLIECIENLKEKNIEVSKMEELIC